MNVLTSNLLEGDVAIITGGGTGIGYAIAKGMLQCGARVAICGRREAVLQKASDELRGLFPHAVPVHCSPCDIRDIDSCKAFVDGVLEKFGRIDVLINNAGGQFPAAAEHISSKGFNTVVQNNLIGTWNMTSTVARAKKGGMIARKKGRIVNIIAVITRGFPGMVHTGAARAGVENMTKTLAVEWPPNSMRRTHTTLRSYNS